MHSEEAGARNSVQYPVVGIFLLSDLVQSVFPSVDGTLRRQTQGGVRGGFLLALAGNARSKPPLPLLYLDEPPG